VGLNFRGRNAIIQGIVIPSAARNLLFIVIPNAARNLGFSETETETELPDCHSDPKRTDNRSPTKIARLSPGFSPQKS
jgi:hypothetical protein